MCHSAMKLELNCSERKTMSWCDRYRGYTLAGLCDLLLREEMHKYTYARDFKKFTSGSATLTWEGEVATIC